MTMTQSASASHLSPAPAPLRLPVPRDHLVFGPLPTDFYPWTEVLAELELRQTQALTGVLDVQQGERWARFVWVRGELRGGIGAGGREVSLAGAMRGLPRAFVTLSLTEILVADLVWACRQVSPQSLNASWPAAHAQLERERFGGVVISGPHSSFWEDGRVVTGSLPQPGASCLAIAAPGSLDREALIEVWSELIALTRQAHPGFDELWKQLSLQASARYPVLDPFAGEVTVSRGQLRVHEDVPAQELRPALLATYRACLSRLGLNLSDLPLNLLRRRADWAATGLEQK
ncbi:hypothetical protein SAMN04488058_103179 [Deinococcus reticulitermitis]|uniref:Uncharacterized protein n=2 Tax=Deinococcus reticulitermitis TaxID=856736 RepID=A0A1H6VID9_9DEIO|nr:hypothetical protein SAMN04488058_103179 [Deinococcus reticulitermitis]